MRTHKQTNIVTAMKNMKPKIRVNTDRPEKTEQDQEQVGREKETEKKENTEQVASKVTDRHTDNTPKSKSSVGGPNKISVAGKLVVTNKFIHRKKSQP